MTMIGLISTLPVGHTLLSGFAMDLHDKGINYEIIETRSMNIKGCIGCNACWLMTPGRCVIKDDYEKLLKLYLSYDAVIFFTDTKFGNITYRLKHIIDRILPLATMHLHFVDGQMRHLARYEKELRMGILYEGSLEGNDLNPWMKRVMLNIHGTSLGVYPTKDKEVLLHELTHDQRFT